MSLRVFLNLAFELYSNGILNDVNEESVRLIELRVHSQFPILASYLKYISYILYIYIL